LTIAAHADELAKANRLPEAGVVESIVTEPAEAPPVRPTLVADADLQAIEFQLEAFINGVSTGLLGAFRRRPDGSFSVAPEELRELGLIPDSKALDSDGMIDLGRLPDVTYDYDEAAQAIRFVAGDRQRIARKIGRERDAGDAAEIERGFGALVNYTLTANFDTAEYWHLPDYSGLFGYADARLFTRYGTLDSAFSARSNPDGNSDYVTRLETAWGYSDPESLRSYIAGDFISGGLAWTRPIRMGGVQLRRNFGLRPDLITLPVPELAGSAAVPSAVDIYLNGVKTYSNDVPGGPFVVDDLPVITGPGVAKVVVRDTVTGQERETEVAFYASALLLREGLADYALEAGFARRDYGIESNSYDEAPIASGSLRYGLANSVTLEGHGEAGAGLLNGGLGVAIGLGGWGVGSVAAAGSDFEGDEGGLVAASFETALFDDWRLFLRSQRTFRSYQDLAAVTADIDDADRHIFSVRPPKALDQISLGVPLRFDTSSLNMSYTHLENADGDESKILSLSYDRPFFGQSTFFATAYADLDNTDDIGIYAGITMTLGGNITGSTGVEYNRDQGNAFIDAIKPDQDEDGSFGWRVRAAGGDTVNTRASAAYVGRYARIEAGAQQYDDTVNAAAQIAGAVVAADGDVFLTRRIEDSFAIVDVGASGVEVSAANRTIGTSGYSGKVVVPSLTPYEKTRIAIDPTSLPVDADIPETSRVVLPADKTGVVVAFKAKAEGASALVQFVDGNRQPLEAGLGGELTASNADFIVGYGGEAYISGLLANNDVTIDLAGGTQCRAQFDFRKEPGEQQLIEGVPCL
jgi:outer membrane usher protein